jgi:hypothetical protein
VRRQLTSTLSSRVNRQHDLSARTAMRSLRHRFVQLENVIHRTLIGHSIDLLRWPSVQCSWALGC